MQDGQRQSDSDVLGDCGNQSTKSRYFNMTGSGYMLHLVGNYAEAADWSQGQSP
jgi:hypothetical protein